MAVQNCTLSKQQAYNPGTHPLFRRPPTQACKVRTRTQEEAWYYSTHWQECYKNKAVVWISLCFVNSRTVFFLYLSLSLSSRTYRKVSELWTEPSSPEVRNVRESRIKKSLESENFSLRTGSQRLMSSTYAGWHTIDRNVANRLNSTQQTDLGFEKASIEQRIEAEPRDALNFWNRRVLSLPLQHLFRTLDVHCEAFVFFREKTLFSLSLRQRKGTRIYDPENFGNNATDVKLISCCTVWLILRPDSRTNCQNWLAKSRQKHQLNTRISLPECANCLTNLRRSWSSTSENPWTSLYITQIHNPAESTNQKDRNKIK
jgi:hypothetical protein